MIQISIMGRKVEARDMFKMPKKLNSNMHLQGQFSYWNSFFEWTD
jgi:hypothetical protein